MSTNQVKSIDNLRYAFSSCVFGFPEKVSNISTPCVVSCHPVEPALEFQLKDPNPSSLHTFCGDDSFADNDISQCKFCYGLTSQQAYLSNCTIPFKGPFLRSHWLTATSCRSREIQLPLPNRGWKTVCHRADGDFQYQRSANYHRRVFIVRDCRRVAWHQEPRPRHRAPDHRVHHHRRTLSSGLLLPRAPPAQAGEEAWHGATSPCPWLRYHNQHTLPDRLGRKSARLTSLGWARNLPNDAPGPVTKRVGNQRFRRPLVWRRVRSDQPDGLFLFRKQPNRSGSNAIPATGICILGHITAR